MGCKIGVDGGGTKTECILVDDSGALVARHVAPGSNPSIVGEAKAGKIVAEALRTLKKKGKSAYPIKVGTARRAVRILKSSPRPEHVERRERLGEPPLPSVTVTLLCMAGSRTFWRGFARKRKGWGRVIAVDDSLPVLELATGGGPGLVLHAGTGSFVAARSEALSSRETRSARAPFGKVHYAGGLGWRLGDPGSGYDIGRRAIARAILERQGWMPRSGLTKLFGGEAPLAGKGDIKRRYYAKTTASDIARLAPGVLRLARRGDPAARRVVEESVGALLELALTVASKLFPETSLGALRVGLSGPILTHPVALEVLAAAKSGLAPMPLEGTPIEGVRGLLARLRG
jgi:N-acetylglucosamine kinase-like BadF-type ATPase